MAKIGNKESFLKSYSYSYNRNYVASVDVRLMCEKYYLKISLRRG